MCCKAYYIKDPTPKWIGNASVYRLDPPFEGNEYVVVSTVNNNMARETMIFAWDVENDLPVYSEPYHGLEELGDLGIDNFIQSHSEALKRIGYEIMPSLPETIK